MTYRQSVSMISYTVDQKVAIITWAMTSPMNVLNDESIPAFEAALQRAYADDSVRGIIITSNKPEFVAGADLKMILRNNDKDPADMLPLSLELNRIFRRIELSGKPTIAAINGTALGGGYEICLACHQRIALNNPKTIIGLVEVTIGLLPGAGGTQRLPRMLGFRAALPLLLEGKKVGVQEARQLGLIDDIADSPAVMMAKAHAWIAANPKPVKPWDEVDHETGKLVSRDRFTPPGGDVSSATGPQTFSAAMATLMAKTHGNYPAPLEIMACVYEGLPVSIDQGLAIEAQHFAKVATSKVAGNLIKTLFLGLNEINKGARRPNGIPKTDIKKLGVLGVGSIGAEIIRISTLAGIEVILEEASVEAAERSENHWRNEQRFQECDLIIQGDTDKLNLNGSAVNTTELTLIAPTASNQLIRIRFFSPVDKGMLVEVVAGHQTSDHVLAVAMDYVRKIRKTPIVVNDSPHGYVTRCLTAYLDEGQQLLREGVSPVLIENAGKTAGMSAGPLALTQASAQETTVINSVNPVAEKQLHSPTNVQPTLDEITIRLLYRQAIEAVRCFDANVVSTKLEADLGSILGWGFPSYTGGALSFIDFVGVETFVQTSDRLADTYGERFRLVGKMRGCLH